MIALKILIGKLKDIVFYDIITRSKIKSYLLIILIRKLGSSIKLLLFNSSIVSMYWILKWNVNQIMIKKKRFIKK